MIGALALVPARTGISALITFDGSGASEGAAIDSQFSGVTFSAAILSLPGDPLSAFYGDNSNVANNLDTVTANPSFSGPFISDTIVGGDPTVTGIIQVTFTAPANDVSFWIADIDAPPGEMLSVQAFDSLGVQIGTTTISSGDPGTGDGIATLVSLPYSGIGKLDITVANATGHTGWGLDSLSFTNVPEPASTVCAIAVGGMSLSRWRRKR